MADDEKKNGDGGADRRARRITPVVVLPSPEAAARQLGHLEVELRRLGVLCVEVGRIVREGGYDARSRAFLSDAAAHFEDAGKIASGTGRALRRLAQTG
jgi:hypothetical protein